MTQTEVVEIIDSAYQDNAGRLVNWALKKGLSAEDAEEICHETMFLLYIKAY